MYDNNHYNKDLRLYAHELRNNSISKAEKYLWKALKKGQQGVKFKRQRPISNFIVDFFAQEIGLIVEVNGSSHLHKESYDAYRKRKLSSLGFHLLFFSEGEVMHNLGDVLAAIQYAIYCLRGDEKEH